MGWWKCNSRVFYCDVAVELKNIVCRGDNKQNERVYLFIVLLSNYENNLSSPSGLQSMSMSTLKQCQIVWDTCIKHNVLRKDGNGYSAREWMQEQGLLPDEQDQTTPSEQLTQEQPKRQYEVKEQVRPNVRLSRKEIEELKKDYSDDEITRMLDKLSDYKQNTGRNYSSDYQAIRKWVYKTLEAPEKKKPEIIEFPDWVYGIKEGTNDKG